MSTVPLRDVREIIREEPSMHAPILGALAGGPRTIPELADLVGHPSYEVTFWVMGMRRYRMVVELPEPDDDGYYRYAVAEVAS